MLRALATLVLAFLLVARSAQAGVLVVGPGQPYTQLQAAVDAATDGDVVLVKSGDYAEGFILGHKSLSIVADTNADVVLRTRVSIASIDAAHEVILAGIRVEIPPNTANGWGSALQVFSCTGSVRVLECELHANYGGADLCNPADGAYVLNSTDVAFTRCQIFGATRLGPQSNWAGIGLHSAGSRVALYDSEIVGGAGGTDQVCSNYAYGDGGDGGWGAWIVNGTLFASGSTFRGGDGGDASAMTTLFVFGGDGGTAIVAHASAPNATAVHLLDSRLIPGAGGALLPPVPPGSIPGQPGLPVYTSGNVTVTNYPGPAHLLSAPRIVREGSMLDLTLAGPPGDALGWFVSGRANWMLDAPFAGVRLYQQMPPGRFARIGMIPGSGVLHHAVPLGMLPQGSDARVHHVQSVSSLGGVLRLGTGQPFVVIDSSY